MDTEREQEEKLWRASHLTPHTPLEERDQLAWSWAARIVQALVRKGLDAPKELLVGTVHHTGQLQEVILFLWELAQRTCACRSKWEERHENVKDAEWRDIKSNHDCLSQKAKDLLENLSGENA